MRVFIMALVVVIALSATIIVTGVGLGARVSGVSSRQNATNYANCLTSQTNTLKANAKWHTVRAFMRQAARTRAANAAHEIGSQKTIDAKAAADYAADADSITFAALPHCAGLRP